MKILKKCGREFEHALRSRWIEPCSTEEYINAAEDIVTRTKICRTWNKLDIKSPNKPFIKNDKPRETLKPKKSNNNEQRKCHKCGGIAPQPINALKKQKSMKLWKQRTTMIKKTNLMLKRTKSETSESDEINIINAHINNIDSIYEVLDVNSRLPQVGTSDTSLSNIQDAKLYRTKQAKVMGYAAGRSSISIFMVGNQGGKVNLDTGEYCTCAGKTYLKTIVPDWEKKPIPIQGVKFSSASESMKPLGIIELTLIFTHPSQCLRLKVEF
ncbi:hypothetical protein O181_079837 [Austropuccinia psidii MF-1]|uniref:Uncharacterized protein n=1 Tax=Austropuccinia psidii MF-1 TaxID=1389203 RepID=A0A9Q3FMU7_9BASI|nr:hypothetical protein [Austropuccinia psidii MF-1]